MSKGLLRRVLLVMSALMMSAAMVVGVDPAVAQERPVDEVEPFDQGPFDDSEFEGIEPPPLDEGEGLDVPDGFDPTTGEITVPEPVPGKAPERVPVVGDGGKPIVDFDAEPADAVLPVLDGKGQSSVAVNKGKNKFKDTPFGLTVAPGLEKKGGQAVLRVLGRDKAREITPRGLAVAELRLSGFGAKGNGNGNGKGLGLQGRELPDRGKRSGFTVEVDPKGLPEVSQNVLDRLAIWVWAGCEDVKKGCQIAEPLETFVDADGMLSAELPPSVVEELGGIVEVPGEGNAKAAGRGFSIKSLSALMLQGGSSVYTGVAPGVSGPSGSYAASSGAGLETWQVGTHTGYASLSYPIPLPPAVGPMPSVGVSYSSGSVDGMNSSTNNQPSKVGLGWEMTQPMIRRVTRNCAGGAVDNNGQYTGNLCLPTTDPDDGFTLSMDGVGGRLVKLGADQDHPRYSDPLVRVQAYELEVKNDMRIWKVTAPSAAGTGAGDTDGMLGEWWEITAGDGTLHVFGRNWVLKPTGAVSNDPLSQARTVHTNLELNSVQVVPVRVPGMGGGECHGEVCPIETAWYLDQVIDGSGNMSVYGYWVEENVYKSKNWGSYQLKTYDRSINAQFIDYGATWGEVPKTAIQTPAAFRVTYDYQWRNEPNDILSGQGWHDTPVDLQCKLDQPCDEKSPSFWTQVRLYEVTTSAGTQKASRFRFSTYWPVVAGSENKLWLSSIQQLDPNSPSNGLPPTNFWGVLKPNRVNFPTGVSPMEMYRVRKMRTSYGGDVEFTYGQPYPPTASAGVCSKGATPPNGYVRLPCNMFPAYDAHTGNGGWVLWNSYVVTKLRETPRFGPSNDYTELSYHYDVAPDWAYTGQYGFGEHDAGQCKVGWGCNHWNDYRGHRQVSITDRVGAKSIHYTYTGMWDDRFSVGNTGRLGIVQPSNPAAKVSRPEGGQLDNEGWAAGLSLGTTSGTSTGQITGKNMTLTEASTNTTKWPGSIRITSRKQYSYFIDPAGVQPTEQRRLTQYFDSIGRLTRVADDGAYNYAGSTWTNGDERTTFYHYSDNLTDWIRNLPRLITTRAGITSSDPWAGRVSATALRYDGQAFGVAPTKGLLTNQLEQIRQDASGNPVWHRTDFTHWPDGQVKRQTDAATGAQTKYTYDTTYGWLKTVDGPNSNDTTTFVVDARFGNQTSINPPTADPTTLTYDAYGRLTDVKQPGSTLDSHEFVYGLSPNHNAAPWVKTRTLRDASEPSADRYVESWAYMDGFGRTIQTQSRLGTTSGMAVSSTAHGPNGAVSRASRTFANPTNPGLGLLNHSWTAVARTETTYASNGTVTNRSYSAGSTTVQATSTIKPAGVKTITTDPLGRQTSATSDVFGNTIKTVDALGGVTTSAYNVRDQITSIADPGNATITWQFNRWENRPTKLIDPDLGTISYSYDSAGRVATQTDGNGTTLSFAYHPDGRAKDIKTNAGQIVSSWAYDNAGRVTGSTHNNNPGQTQSNTVTRGFTYYSDTGELKQATWNIPGLGEKDIDYTYRDSGQIDTVDYPGANDTSQAAYNRLEQPWGIKHNGLNVAWHTNYSAAGQMTSTIAGQPAWPISDRAVISQQWSYTDWSQRLASANAVGVEQDDAVHDQLVRAYRGVLGRDPNGWEYRWYSQQRAFGASMGTIEGQLEASTEYDATWANYVDSYTGETLNPATSNEDFVQWAYDWILKRPPSGRGWGHNFVTFLNNNSWTRGQVAAVFTDHVHARQNPDIGGSDANTAPAGVNADSSDRVVQRSYTYDQVGNLTKTWDNGVAINQSTCHGYDNKNQLKWSYTRGTNSACSGENSAGPDPYRVDYAYALNGNITSATGDKTPGGNYTYGAGNAGPHAVTNANGRTFSYDNAGNMTSRDRHGTGTQTLTYTLQNRLKTINGAGTSMTALYDAEGNRVKRTLNGNHTYYLGETYETNGTTSTIHHRLGGQHIGSTIGGTFTANVTDHLGSAGITRNSSTGATNIARYQPFGQVRGNTDPIGSGHPFDIGFTGQTNDPGTELIDYNARHYDPTLARFPMADPVLDGTNRYTYVRNNPLRFTDPTGNVCYDSGPKKGQCYEGADGEGSAQSSQQEAASVKPAISLVPVPLVPDLSDVPTLSGADTSPKTVQRSIIDERSCLSNEGTGSDLNVDVGCGAEIATALPVWKWLKWGDEVVDGARTGLDDVRRLGNEGELLSGIVKNTERIPSASGTAAYRIPDGLDHSAQLIQEVKNVSSLSYTRQLRDFSAYSQANGYSFELFVRPTTQLSGPLQTAVANGDITLRFLP